MFASFNKSLIIKRRNTNAVKVTGIDGNCKFVSFVENTWNESWNNGLKENMWNETKKMPIFCIEEVKWGLEHLLYRRSEMGAVKLVWKIICEMNKRKKRSHRDLNSGYWIQSPMSWPLDHGTVAWFIYIVLSKIPSCRVVWPVQKEHHFKLYKI